MAFTAIQYESKAGKSVHRAAIVTDGGGKNSGQHRRVPGTDNATAPGTQHLGPGAFDAAKTGGAGADRPSCRRWRERERDGAAAWHLAQNGRHSALKWRRAVARRLSAKTLAATQPRASIRSSARPSSTASIRNRTCATSSSTRASIRSTASTMLLPWNIGARLPRIAAAA
jgi:hypothetical protein